MSGPDARLGSTVGGKYRIARFLAEGGMGKVYEAQHLVVKRRFAVKFLRSELVRRRDVLARFTLEAESAGALESENIAAALDFGMTNEGDPYIVMEYLDGIALGGLLSVLGPLPFERAVDLVVQACAGMQQAHDAGVLHRDLKPQNLFVCRRSDATDLVKIVDFGVAKLLDGAASGVTGTGGMVGTPSYMSPEQARGEPNIDRRADVYALGVILYELISGRTPHPGESYNAVIHHISTQPPLPIETGGRDLPVGLIEIVQRALHSNPERRQASAADFARELMPFARRQVWPVVRESAAAGLDSTMLDPGAKSSAADPPPSGASAVPIDNSGTRSPPRRAWPQLTLAAAVVSAALLALALGLWPARRDDVSKAPAALSPPAAASADATRTRPADVPAASTVPAPTPAAAPPVELVAEKIAAAQPVAAPAPSPNPKPLRLARKSSSAAETRPRDETERPAAAPVAPITRAAPKAAPEFDHQNPY
jgi:eukaryotic-like serine/threonine-protein kinase